MILSHCSHETVLHVARNMRDRDKQEIYNVRWHDSPFDLMNAVMSQRDFAWVAWLDGAPVAVFGGIPAHPGVWNMFAFATDAFPRLALGLTRFATKTVIPTLFQQMEAHRLQCDSHEKHTDAHQWLERMGARRESVKVAFGKDGADYFTYTVTKKSTKST